ncbi:hypothetical protein C9374_003262 [Naegleria lovaniensis]|uniref:Zn(2)-C6 fungal-type domain-containing protein n=1 Tax=Naegleria lovaniensis TaxID=51637 RepID=A0AA88GMK7_NAELO|nr:uncharacterized protein C9374_003262 [Naegleria lovaniensis]KAG2385447.1 hypothetical protein C9374_003262 [Naegleria lovaniensis]
MHSPHHHQHFHSSQTTINTTQPSPFQQQHGSYSQQETSGGNVGNGNYQAQSFAATSQQPQPQHNLYTTSSHITVTQASPPQPSSSSSSFVAPVLINGVVLNPVSSSSGLPPPTHPSNHTTLPHNNNNNNMNSNSNNNTTPALNSPSSPELAQQGTMNSVSSQPPPSSNYLPPNSIVYHSPVALYPIACSSCRKQHKKCDRKIPSCDRCIQKGLTCTYKESKRISTTTNASSVSANDSPSEGTQQAAAVNAKKRNSRKRKKNQISSLDMHQVVGSLVQNPSQSEERNATSPRFSSSNHSGTASSRHLISQNLNSHKFYEEGLSKRQVIDCYYSFACDGFPLMDREDMEQCPENYLDYLTRPSDHSILGELNQDEMECPEGQQANSNFKHLQELVALFLSVKAVCEMRCGMTEVAEKSAKLARNAICNYFDQHERFLVATTFSHLSQYEILNSRITNAKFYLQFVAFYLQNRFVQTAECDTNDSSTSTTTAATINSNDSTNSSHQASSSLTNSNNGNTINHHTPAEHDMSQCRHCLSKMTQYEKNLENNRQYIDQSILSMGGGLSNFQSFVDGNGQRNAAKSFFDLSFTEGGFLREIPRYFTMFTGLKFPPQWITSLNQEISHKNCYDILKLLDMIFTFVKQHIKEKLSNTTPSNNGTTSPSATLNFDSSMNSKITSGHGSSPTTTTTSSSSPSTNTTTTPTPCFFQGNSQCLSLYEHMLDIVLNGIKIRILSKLGNHHSATSREIIEQSAYNITMSTQHDLFPLFLPYLVPFISAAALVHLRIVKMILNNNQHGEFFNPQQQQQQPNDHSMNRPNNETSTTPTMNAYSPQSSQLERRRMFEELLEHSQMHTQHFHQQLHKIELNGGSIPSTNNNNNNMNSTTPHNIPSMTLHYEEILRKDLRAMHILARRFKLVSTQYSKLLREMEETLNQLDMMKQQQQQQSIPQSSHTSPQVPYSKKIPPQRLQTQPQTQPLSSQPKTLEGSSPRSASSTHSATNLPAQFIPSFLHHNPHGGATGASSTSTAPLQSGRGTVLNGLQSFTPQPSSLDGQIPQPLELIMMANNNNEALSSSNMMNNSSSNHQGPNLNQYFNPMLGHNSQHMQNLMMNMIMMGGSMVPGLSSASTPNMGMNNPTSTNFGMSSSMSTNNMMSMPSYDPNSSLRVAQPSLSNWNSSSMEGMVITPNSIGNNSNSKASSPQSSTVFDPFLTEEDLDMIFSLNHFNSHVVDLSQSSGPVNAYAKMDIATMHALLDQHLQNNTNSTFPPNQNERNM